MANAFGIFERDDHSSRAGWDRYLRARGWQTRHLLTPA
jgi:hypothetical protein